MWTKVRSSQSADKTEQFSYYEPNLGDGVGAELNAQGFGIKGAKSN